MSGHLPEHDLLTVHEVAQLLRCDDTTIRRWIRNGVLEAVSLPHVNKRQAYRIRRSTIDTLDPGELASGCVIYYQQFSTCFERFL